MKRRAQPPIVLEIRFDGAATPARVAETARFVDEVLKSADPYLPDGSVTLVVSNYATVAGIRAWDPPGKAAVRRCERYLTNPTKDVRLHPEARDIARAFAKAGADMARYTARVTKPATKTTAARTIARIDEQAVRVAEELATARPIETNVPEMLGGTEVYSQVYRVGRVDDGREIHARIRIDGRPVEVALVQAAIGDAFDAAKSGETVTLRLEGKWRRDADGSLVIDPAQTLITSIGEGWKPITGAEFVDAIHEAIPDAFSDLDDILPDGAH
jgi:hypothetical protein